MALTPGRWISAAILGCALLTTGLAGTSRSGRSIAPSDPPEVLNYRRIQHRTLTAARRLKALSRRDSVLPALPAAEPRDARTPLIVVDPGLPETHRSLIERAIDRQWRHLGIDSASVPVAIVIVVDTASSKSPLGGARGAIAFDYVLADEGAHDRCVAIVALHDRALTRPGTHRRLAETIAPERRGSALLGPCAFQARFGVAGVAIDAWLRARSYDLAARPAWTREIADTTVDSSGGLTAGIPGVSSGVEYLLSPDARACAAGNLARCDASLIAPPGMRDRVPEGGLVMMALSWDQHWSGLSPRYLSDLVTALGAERFEKFWRSDLPPDAALRAASMMPLNVWTQRWASGLVGPQRPGPAATLREFLGVIVLAVACLAVTAWGWQRRQIR